MSKRLDELERAKVRLEALVRAAVAVDGDSTAIAAWQETVLDSNLVNRATHALARVYAEIEVAKGRAAGEPS